MACLTDAIHAEPLSAWFGEGWHASADGQAYYLGEPGEAGGLVNARYGRDPIVKIHTTITDRYAPLHQTVIAGTAHEAIHALDGILGHTSGVSPSALHVDGGGVSDIVFALMHLLGLDFEPRIPRLSDRRLYAFEPARRYGRLAPLFGQRLDRALIASHWDEIGCVVEALRSRTVTPSLILRKLSAYRQKNSLAAALREVGRVERTLFTLRWFKIPWAVDRDRRSGRVGLLRHPPAQETAMNKPCAPNITPAAIHTDLGAIFVSLELSRSRWVVTSLSPGGAEKMSKHSVPGGDLAGLMERFRLLVTKASARTGWDFPIVTIQEAGLDGFWIHRALVKEGIESHVVDPASIATSRRRRRAKTDRIDGEALVRTLLASSGESRGSAPWSGPRRPQRRTRAGSCANARP